MAEIIQSTSQGRHKRRPSIAPIKLDMTPLVDLGFLLLTFFILTTHLLDQRVMNLTIPLPGPPTLANNTLTILLAEKGVAFGYKGLSIRRPHVCNRSAARRCAIRCARSRP